MNKSGSDAAFIQLTFICNKQVKICNELHINFADKACSICFT